jgi:hypothetical protein
MTGRDVLLDPGGEKAALQDWVLGVLYLCLDVLSGEVFRSEPDYPDLVFRLEVLMGVRMSAIDPMPVVHDGAFSFAELISEKEACDFTGAFHQPA